jgi:hypothetical protein
MPWLEEAYPELVPTTAACTGAPTPPGGFARSSPAGPAEKRRHRPSPPPPPRPPPAAFPDPAADRAVRADGRSRARDPAVLGSEPRPPPPRQARLGAGAPAGPRRPGSSVWTSGSGLLDAEGQLALGGASRLARSEDRQVRDGSTHAEPRNRSTAADSPTRSRPGRHPRLIYLAIGFGWCSPSCSCPACSPSTWATDQPFPAPRRRRHRRDRGLSAAIALRLIAGAEDEGLPPRLGRVRRRGLPPVRPGGDLGEPTAWSPPGRH